MDNKTQQLLEAMKEQGLKDLKVLVKNQVAIAYDPAVAIAVEKAKALIPGNWDDAFIDIIVKTAGPILKEELMKALEKLDALASAPASTEPA